MPASATQTAATPLRCLVSGGFGYAGAWISQGLARAGHEVFILSRKERGPDIGQPYELVRADVEALCPESLSERLPERLDCLIHAASSNEAFVPDYARRALLVNALGTRNILQALVLRGQKYARPLPLVLYMSTFHVYGRQYGRVEEQDLPAPRNDYALTHFFGEEYCRMYARLYDLPQIIVRLSNGYGAPQTPHSDKWHLLLNDLCRRAVTQGELVLRSDPATPRDFVWLGDVARVMEKLLPRRDLAGSLFNLASARSVSIGEVAALVARVASDYLGKSIPVRFEHSAQPCAQTEPPPLCISNSALCSAVGIRFQDRMEEEVLALLRLCETDPKTE